MANALSELVEGENGCRKYFMTISMKSYVARLGFEIATPKPAVRCAADCSMEPGMFHTSFQHN